MDMRVDLLVPVGLSIAEVAAFIRRCEEAGFSGVGVHDHPESGRDAYVTLTLAARHTSRVTLYPAVTNPVTRHPMVLSALAQSLEEVAPGRTMIAMGVGGDSVRSTGQGRATLSSMRDAVTSIRRLLAGEAVSFGAGPPERLRYLPRRSPPLFVAGTGPRQAELAGEVGDGAFLWVGLHPAAVRAARGAVERGAVRAGRDPARVPIIFATQVHLEPDARTTRAWARHWLSQGAGRRLFTSHAHWLRQAGLEFPGARVPERLSDGLISRLCDALGIYGPAEHCAHRLQAAADAGVEHLFLMFLPSGADRYTMPEAEVQLFQREVFPRLGR